jgi:hypothetical protein
VIAASRGHGPLPAAQALRWVREQLPGASPSHLRTRPWGSVWRVTRGEEVWWFKINQARTVYEPRLLARLAGTGSSLLTPCVVHPGEPWTLLADAGRSAREHLAAAPAEDVIALWVDVMPRYAELQRGTSAPELLAAGVPDLSPDGMVTALEELLADARWFTRTAAPDLTAEGRSRLQSVRPALTRAGAALGGGVVAALQHDDLHDGNVFVHRAGFRIIDWGDAVVSHPFSTLRVTLDVLADRLRLPTDAPALARVRHAYLEPWLAGGESWSSLHEQADLAIRTAGLLRAAAWARALGSPDVAEELDFAAAGAVSWWLLRLADDLAKP